MSILWNLNTQLCFDFQLLEAQKIMQCFGACLSLLVDVYAFRCHSLLSLNKELNQHVSPFCLSLRRVPCERSSLRTSVAVTCVSSVGSASTWWSVSARKESFSIAAASNATTAAPLSACPRTPSTLRTVWNHSEIKSNLLNIPPDYVFHSYL